VPKTLRRALIIAHEPDGPGGQVAVRLAQRGFETTTHIVTHDYDEPNTATPFPDFNDYDLVAIMGSIRSLTRKDEIDTWVHDELDRIRAAQESNVPMLGVCFGGQLLAEALGGTVEVAPVTEIGWHTIDDAPGQKNPAGPGPWMEWHHDRFVAPPGSTLLAQTDDAAQMFSIGRSVGTQFHPEVDVAHISDWLATADPEYLAEYDQHHDMIMADIMDHSARNTVQCHAFVDWFLDTIAFPSDLQETTQ
jgi:GMP synthase-like glutamine amidotransferase